MTMLERIVAVLHRARVNGGWDDEDVARRVLNEMREPTECMAENSGTIDKDDAAHGWCNMIDATLAEAPEHTSSEIGHG